VLVSDTRTAACITVSFGATTCVLTIVVVVLVSAGLGITLAWEMDTVQRMRFASYKMREEYIPKNTKRSGETCMVDTCA
jgi:gamma-glutamylcysteine synthetase